MLEALPRIYQVTPDIPDRRRATQQKEVRPSPADSLNESQLAARSGPSPSRRTSPTSRMRTASLIATATVLEIPPIGNTRDRRRACAPMQRVGPSCVPLGFALMRSRRSAGRYRPAPSRRRKGRPAARQPRRRCRSAPGSSCSSSGLSRWLLSSFTFSLSVVVGASAHGLHAPGALIVSRL